MSQIKPIQIIPGRENKVNPISALPIDLNPAQRSLLLDPVRTVENPTSDQGIGLSGDESASNSTTSSLTVETALAESDPVPATPAIISVKDQIIKFMPDGTTKIDLILEVQDIQGA